MKKSMVIILLIFLIVQAASSDEGFTRQSLAAVILVEDRFAAADRIETWADEAGGYLLSRVENQVILRVPSSKLEDLSEYLVAVAEEVISIRQNTEDISQELLESEAGITSKQELFDQALLLFDYSDFATTTEIENEIFSILRELEALKGTLGKLRAESELAHVRIDFSMEEEELPESLPSSFPWINVVNFYLLMNEFE